MQWVELSHFDFDVKVSHLALDRNTLPSGGRLRGGLNSESYPQCWGLDSCGQNYPRLAAYPDFQEMPVPDFQQALITFWHNSPLQLEHLRLAIKLEGSVK